MSSQVIQLSPNITVNEIKVNKIRYIIIKHTFIATYLKFPPGLVFIKKGDQLLFNDNNNVSKYPKNLFFRLFNQALSFHYKSVRLNGIGLKVKYDPIFNTLELKLGLSHIIKLSLPKHITKVTISKNIVSFVSYDIIGLGNFLISIKKLKAVNIYKGSGISYKKEKIVLKKIKKK